MFSYPILYQAVKHQATGKQFVYDVWLKEMIKH